MVRTVVHGYDINLIALKDGHDLQSDLPTAQTACQTLDLEHLIGQEVARLLDTAVRLGFVDNCAGICISLTARRLCPSHVAVWNLLREDGNPCRQTAMPGCREFL